ncbi:MAG: hypothetical protein H7Z75_05485 [Ferruginibacter sp.]|nr:hypothetical protein [Cytophagales bacterium]
MIRYINYALSAILIMLILPLAPVLAIAAIPIAFVYFLILPRENALNNFSFRRVIRRIGFKPPKKALAFYVCWLYCHLVFLGVFSSGMFRSVNFSSFWPFSGEIQAYDVTEFMVYTGIPLFCILVFGLYKNDLLDEDKLEYAHEGTPSVPATRFFGSEPMRNPEPTPMIEPVREEAPVNVSLTASAPLVMEAPSLTADNRHEQLSLLQLQQRVDVLDAELQSLKSALTDRMMASR